jgi:zinc/manganese transport system substrate-binding protein/manganese/iron transport system substrate-binding protein
LRRALTALLGAGLLASGCTIGSSPSPDPEALRVATSTTVLADLVAQVGGPHVSVTSIIPKGGEVHTFDPSPGDIGTISAAELVIVNGVGLDEWVADLVVSADSTAPIVELGEDLEGVEYLAGSEHHDDEEEGEHPDEEEGEHHDHEGVNPHLWLNVDYARKYVARISQALMDADPDDADAYAARAATFDARLAELDSAIRNELAQIPEGNRSIVTLHEAFPYFAAAYGLEVIGVVIDAPGQDPSAGEIADLVDAIRGSGARAVFTEPQFSPDLAQVVASEAGVAVVRDLYSDTLGDPPVDTYEGMMRWNLTRVAEALR